MPAMGTPGDELLRELTRSGVRPGDEVVVPSYGTPEAAEAVLLAGARPVFVDIDANTYCIDPAAVADAVTPQTAAVIVVHTFGHPADMVRLGELGKRHGLLVIEHGARPVPDAEMLR